LTGDLLSVAAAASLSAAATGFAVAATGRIGAAAGFGARDNPAFFLCGLRFINEF
jgi:hypothetical protein